MKILSWDSFDYGFKFLCIVITIAIFGTWLQRYVLDQDISIIETVSYFDSEDDVLPMMSVCFKQDFTKVGFGKMGFNFSGAEYGKYLLSNEDSYFDPAMAGVDYESVSTNISDFLISYMVWYYNGSFIWDTIDTPSWKTPYHTGTIHSGGYIVKCFGLELVDKNVKTFVMLLKREIFPDKARRRHLGFAVLFHYPNQILQSFATLMNTWNNEDNASKTYWMEFNVRRMEAFQHRYKPKKKNCIRDWKNYDNIMLEEHVRYVGCKTPYQPKYLEAPICKTKEDMLKANTSLVERLPPCREIASIDVEFFDSFVGEPMKMQGKKQHFFAIKFMRFSSRFKKISTKEEVDLQSLIGYVGGYVGLIMGFALAQIPEVIHNTFDFLSNLRSDKEKRKSKLKIGLNESLREASAHEYWKPRANLPEAKDMVEDLTEKRRELRDIRQCIFILENKLNSNY